MRLSDVARHLGVSKQRVHQLFEGGRLPAPAGEDRRGRYGSASEVRRWAEDWEKQRSVEKASEARRHMRGALVTCFVALSSALSACTGPATSDEWSEFPSGLKARIDAYAAERDCLRLQGTFDTVVAADGSHRDILRYIDSKLEAAGCYG
jgi:hypothetical protein